MLGSPHERVRAPAAAPPRTKPNRAGFGFGAGLNSFFFCRQTLSFYDERRLSLGCCRFGIELKRLLHAYVTVSVRHEQNRHDPSPSFMIVPNSHEQVYIHFAFIHSFVQYHLRFEKTSSA